MSRLERHGRLPSYNPSVHEKLRRRRQAWWILLPICRIRGRSVQLPIPNILPGARPSPRCLWLAFILAVVVALALVKRFFSNAPPTLVFRARDVRKIWYWEIASGHYPSRRRLPKALGLKVPPLNPALPAEPTPRRRKQRVVTNTHGVGRTQRVYLDMQSGPPDVAYPPRPVSGSVADLDVVMDHCDFSENKYVRDCLEVLRVGAGLDNGKRMRRGNIDAWKYVYVNKAAGTTDTDARTYAALDDASSEVIKELESPKKYGAEWEKLILPSLPQSTEQTSSERCDPEHPRIFHMFWTGPFTDKPYLALLSFLFTQNLRLHDSTPLRVCRPVLWLWINPGPAASMNAAQNMFDQQIRSNCWSSPFLHKKFRDIIQFRLWNTTEQLDAIPEIRHEWRNRDLFNSGGVVIRVPKKMSKPTPNENGHRDRHNEDDILHRTGSKSSESYDRLSVILSDMARFVLTHRYGGIYLDADTILLRDWEELWGWKGAFAYRWSRLNTYNTAVLHLNKRSALGTFIFRTALKNGLDFHPMSLTRYMREAALEGLLLRLPDALFDSAWLNTEFYQRDRPPQPYFSDFGEFFDTPSANSAAPQALGFEGFFRGAYSYHFHNYWWRPFDAARNWPDLGTRFTTQEYVAESGDKTDDHRDLHWATVLKRTFESYIRNERPNMYGEWIEW